MEWFILLRPKKKDVMRIMSVAGLKCQFLGMQHFSHDDVCWDLLKKEDVDGVMWCEKNVSKKVSR